MFWTQLHRFSFRGRNAVSAVTLQSKAELAWGGTATISLLKYSNGWEEVEKNLLPKFQGSAEGEGLITREFEILKNLDHPFIVKVLRLEMQNNGRLSLMMEHVRGLPLSECEKFLKTLNSEERIRWVKALGNQIISVLHFLKFRQIIHGDISPENIFVTPAGTIKLIDFGIARHESDLSLPYMIGGRPYFRAPELKKSGETSYSGDVFAAGRVMEWALGDMRDSQLEESIAKMIEKRELPQVALNNFAWWDLLEILPDFTGPCSKIRLKTELELKNQFSYRYGRFFKPAFVTCMLLVLTSWLPQKAHLSVNSLPYSHFTIDQMPDQIFETPVINLPVSSGEMVVSFVIPAQNNRRVIRKIKIKPLEQAKLFEDFKIIDKF